MCHTKLGRKATRVFLRRLFLADAACSPYHFFTREQQRARFISRTTRSHNERFTAPVPRLESCFPANNCDVETNVITTPGLTSALALIKLSWPRTLFCEAITVPNKRRGCDCLGTHVRLNRGVDKHAGNAPHTSNQFHHRHKAFAFGLCICRRQWYAHWQRLTCRVNALLGRMLGVFTRRHRTLHARAYRIFAAHARAENPSATYGRQGAEKDGGIFPR